jgi:hypothetical protein
METASELASVERKVLSKRLLSAAEISFTAEGAEVNLMPYTFD